MNLHGWFRAIRKNWWIVLVTTVLAAGVGIAITLLTPKQYASSVTFFVRTPAEQIGGAYQGDAFAQKRVNSYVQLLESQSLADLILSDTKLDMSTVEVQRTIAAKGDLNTVLLTATATDVSPDRSLVIAKSVASQFVQLVAEIETAPGSQAPTVSLVVTSAAALNPSPVEPRPLVNLSLAILVGATLGVLLTVLREMLDTTIRKSETLAEISGQSVVGVVPFDKTAKNSPLILDENARTSRAESYRQLRTNLLFVDVDNPVKVVVVTSSVPDEGKSCTATNLAVSFADAGQKVLLVEGDLRRPRVADYLGIEGSVGLTNILAGQVAMEDVIQRWGKGSLSVLPSGTVPPNPSELLGSKNMRQLLNSLKEVYDIIIIDTPPLLPVTDAAIIAAVADGALLVVRQGKTVRAQVSSATAALRAVDARLLGSVLNMAPQKGPDGYGYGYGYGNGYGYYSDAKDSRGTVLTDPKPLKQTDTSTISESAEPAAQLNGSHR